MTHLQEVAFVIPPLSRTFRVVEGPPPGGNHKSTSVPTLKSAYSALLASPFSSSVRALRATFAKLKQKPFGTRVFIIPGLHENVTTPLIKLLHMVRTVPAVLLLTESQVFFWGKAGSTGQKSFPLIATFFS